MKAKNQDLLQEVSQITVSYRPKFRACERPQIRESSDGYSLIKQNWDLGKIELLEQFKIILLNTNNRVLGISEISSGGFSSTVADPKVIFGVALKASASFIILVHNHPSGNTNPSPDDIKFTKKCIEGGKILDLPVLDHIIITKESYTSLADDGHI